MMQLILRRLFEFPQTEWSRGGGLSPKKNDWVARLKMIRNKVPEYGFWRVAKSCIYAQEVPILYVNDRDVTGVICLKYSYGFP